MAIGRGQEFLLRITEAADGLKDATGKDLNEMSLKDLVLDGGDLIFERLTDILNFAFEYQNDDYESLTVEWVKKNITFRMIGEIIQEIAEVNNMGWLRPFFREEASKILSMVGQT